ncbi:MAG: PEP-CTERM sorting domain-containing protein [Planctomycetaceae bacterium]|nr:PEP-CTERM sorting domain-containing protein [Planctomycetaceae bacterium]
MRTKFLAVVAILVMTVCNVNANLIVNGDFEQGVYGYTTEYHYNPSGTSPWLYYVGTNPDDWDGGYVSIGDHTSGSGNMMMIDASGGAGGGAGRICWSETVAVTQNTDYTFSAWIAQIYLYGIYSNVQFEINGTVIGNYEVPTNTSEWREFTEVWNSGSAVAAAIIIRETTGNNGSPGNDFALDDISFVPEPTTIVLLGFGILLYARKRL